MARFRLKSAHHLWNSDLKAHAQILGDKEMDQFGDERGTVVGDGTPWVVDQATIWMAPLDAEAEAMVAAELERLKRNEASMNPVEQLPLMLMEMLRTGRDDYPERYLPGFPGTARPQAKAPEAKSPRS